MIITFFIRKKDEFNRKLILDWLLDKQGKRVLAFNGNYPEPDVVENWHTDDLSADENMELFLDTLGFMG